MASIKFGARISVILLVCLCVDTKAKLSDNRTNENDSAEVKSSPAPKKSDGAALIFADEFKQTLERYLFGICPQNYKMPLGARLKNSTMTACDLDTEQVELAGRLATLALRAHTAMRSDCARLGAALANTLGELARTASNRQALASAAASKEEAKKRKLSKSQKAKIQAKQRTALAVKKKAAALAAAAAAKITS